MILDTNALSAWADVLPSIKPRFEAATRLVLPTVVLGEYLFGVLQSRHEKRYQQWLAENLPTVELAAVDQTTAHEYAQSAWNSNGRLRQSRPTMPGLRLSPGNLVFRF